MFKKRQTLNNQKKVNLEDEISQIKNDTAPTAQQQDTLMCTIHKHQVKQQKYESTQAKKLKSKVIQIEEQRVQKSVDRIMMQNMQQQLDTKDALNRYFAKIKTQYISQNPTQLVEQQVNQEDQPDVFRPIEDYQRYNQQKMIEKPKSSVTKNKMGTIIIQDQDPPQMNEQLIQLKQDFGDANSSQAMSEDSVNFQQEFIRKTLTSRNYRSIQQQDQSMGKPVQKKTKYGQIRKALGRVNQSRISKLLTVHAVRKKSERDNMKDQIRYLDARITNKLKELQRKKQTKDQLNQKLSQVSKILQYLYFFGDRVNIDSNGNLSRQEILKAAQIQLPKYGKPQKQLDKQDQNMQCEMISDDQGDEDVYML